MFLDDDFGCAQDLLAATELGTDIEADLLKSGFIPNVSVPVQSLDILGFTMNTCTGTISIQEKDCER